MAKLLILFLCCIIIFGLPSAIQSQEAKINVVYTDWFPYTCQRKQIPSGFEIDIFNSVIEKMNLRAAFKMLPWVRCLKYLEQGKADVLISMLKTPERERYAYYPEEHISVSKTMFFKKSNTHIAFNGSYEELKGYTIGVILGFSYGTAFDQARCLDKDVSIDTKMLITKLLKGRNDLAAENHAVMIAKAFQFGIKDDIQSFGPPIHTQKLYAGFSKVQGLEKICHDFSVHLCDFKKSKQYQAIFEKYGIEFTDMMEPKKKNIGIDI